MSTNYKYKKIIFTSIFITLCLGLLRLNDKDIDKVYLIIMLLKKLHRDLQSTTATTTTTTPTTDYTTECIKGNVTLGYTNDILNVTNQTMSGYLDYLSDKLSSQFNVIYYFYYIRLQLTKL